MNKQHNLYQRIKRLIQIVQEIKTNPNQTPENIFTKFSISKAQFYKDKKTLMDIGFDFIYNRKTNRFEIICDTYIPVNDLSISERLSLIFSMRQLSASGDYLLTVDALNAARKLAADLPEQDKKHQALRLINQHVHDFQYDYTWHYFSDNRGLYTNFIHNVIVAEYQKQGAIPLLFYPEGVWYLKNRNHDILIEPETIALLIQQEMDVLSGQDLSKLVKDAKGTAFKYNKNPFALNLSPDAIMDIFVNAIITPKDKKYVDKYSKLITDDCLPKLINSLEKEKSSIHQKKLTAEKQHTALNALIVRVKAINLA
ncbi:MAG: hypothetical protein OMM_08941 [Candidatus Magnetoglobus multicellularis str. Araruama]|uniref:WYL domain-containing protein n=2 Tax=Candidatus Magnetoglobus multicellularis str. Araruama TaxID=890399 RepID=A0A1V1P612_9BACT|nr:MAG: hypothetical protein OMM_08941 [Candidatus Magnetoglobus multicellularis str. Araruama]